MNLATVSPDYIKALIAANPELAAINQEALAGASTPMPPSIVADKGRFIKKVDGVEETLSFPDTEVYRNAGVVGQPVPQLQCVIMRAKAGKEKVAKPFNGWKVKIDFEAKTLKGKPYHSEYWFILDKEAEIVVKSFEIPLL